MTSKLGNVIMLVSGFIASLFLTNSTDWNIAATIGAMLAGIALANLSLIVLPIIRTSRDWLYPLVSLVIFGGLLLVLRANLFFNLEGLWLSVTQTVIQIAAFASLARLYTWSIRPLQ